MEGIPEPIQEEILLRSSAESLMVCKRVCQSWFDLITDPSFANKHIVRRLSSKSRSRSFYLKYCLCDPSVKDIHFIARDHTTRIHSLVTVCDDDGGEGDILPCVIQPLTLPPIPPTVQMRLPYPFPSKPASSECHGILHIFDRFNSGRIAALVNPLLKQFKLLQAPHFDGILCLGGGLGYDPKANVYKYVKIISDFDCVNPLALVYTLGSGTDPNPWRMIRVDVLRNAEGLGLKGLYWKGAFYWHKFVCSRGTISQDDVILSFDMSEEKFHCIPLPGEACNRLLTLGVWKDSVVIFFGTKGSEHLQYFELWVMVEGSTLSSTHFTKHLTIGPLQCVERAYAFWKDDELLCDTSDGRLVSCNIYTHKLRTVPLPGPIHPGFTEATPLCSTSLVSL